LQSTTNRVAIPLGSGVAAYYVPSNRTNAYVAFDGSDYQMEVYDPTPGVARTRRRMFVPAPTSSVTLRPCRSRWP
jgi:hypothetical protein